MKTVTVWSAQGANTSTSIATAGLSPAQITIWAVSGTPDGTVKIFNDAGGGAPLLLLKTYATPTTAKTFIGPCGPNLVVTLTGNTTGTVGLTAVLP